MHFPCSLLDIPCIQHRTAYIAHSGCSCHLADAHLHRHLPRVFGYQDDMFMPTNPCNLKSKIFALGEWYSCRGLALVANRGVSTLGFNNSQLLTH